MEKKAKKFGAAVTELREARKLSKSKMGALLGGITPQAVLRYESDKKVPEPAVLWRMAVVASDNPQTQHLVPIFLSPLTDSCGIRLHGSLVGLLVDAAYPSRLPTVAEIKPILARAKALLEE